MSDHQGEHSSVEPKQPKQTLKQRLATYRILHRVWPKVSRKGTWYSMVFELAGIITALVIFGISQPDLYRTDMWRIGFENKLNSNPDMVLYAYANHRPLPDVPFIWSSTLTNYNVAISVISLFFLLAKLIAFIMKVYYPAAAVFVNVALTVLYAVSTYGQIGPDYADERYPAPAAWYFRYGCDMAKPYGSYKSCQIAQGSLVVTLYLLVLYLVNLGFSAFAMWPNPANDVDEDEFDEDDPTPDIKQRNLEMQGLRSPMSARMTPYTPRTQAFNTLDRQLPLRQGQDTRFG